MAVERDNQTDTLLMLTLRGLASLVLLATSLPRAIAVDLTPADQRPWVGGSQTNRLSTRLYDCAAG